MKKFQLKSLVVAITIISALPACRKDKIVPNPIDPVQAVETVGVYVLNQGDFQSMPGSLTYYNYSDKATTTDKYLAVNNITAGIGTNDVKIYGSKMYITVDKSGVVNVVDKNTTKLIKQIDFNLNGVSREPRSLAFYKNNAFVTLYDGNVAVIDTASLTISKNIPVGRNPEQMAVSNNKLYVANSGGLSFGNPDKTVSVIDLTTLTETKKVEVIANPGSIAADTFGNIYVLSAGDYADIAPGMTIIDNKTDVVKTTTNALAGAYGTSIVVNGDYAYFIAANNKVLVYNTKTQAVDKENFITDGTVVETPFNLAYDSQTGLLFVADAKNFSGNGELVAFDINGKRQFAVTTGHIPGAIVFLNK
jgi:YVTN family beta-propeller protein